MYATSNEELYECLLLARVITIPHDPLFYSLLLALSVVFYSTYSYISYLILTCRFFLSLFCLLYS